MSDVQVTQKASGEKTPQRSSHWFGLGLPKGRLWGVGPGTLAYEMSEEMERMLRGIHGGTALDAWAPAVDIDRSNGTMIVSAELPGLRKEDIKVEVNDASLVIQGERKQEQKEEREGYHRWERSYGQFYRSIPLPEGAQAEQIEAELKDGVLKVSIPVPETQKKTHQVAVKG
jgi:HSP20 family protein